MGSWTFTESLGYSVSLEMKRDIRHQTTYATISSSVLKSKGLVGLFHILGFTIGICLKVMEFSRYMISYVFCNFNIVIRFLKSSSDLFASKSRLKLLKLTRNACILSLLLLWSLLPKDHLILRSTNFENNFFFFTLNYSWFTMLY